MRFACAALALVASGCVRAAVVTSAGLAGDDLRAVEALAYGRYAAETYTVDGMPWYTVLPDCPCTEPVDDPQWRRSDAGLRRYHRGAVHGYRSAAVYASVAGSMHGQQCTYDAQGALIVDGWAAGTPDTVAPSSEAPEHGHQLLDVMTWESLTRGGTDRDGLLLYQRYWPPNRGIGCVPALAGW